MKLQQNRNASVPYQKKMITIQIISKTDSSILTRNIDPKSKDEFDFNICEICDQAEKMFGKFYLEFDDWDATEEQKKWVEDENS